MTSWKSGLILSALKMYIYIQCIKLSLNVPFAIEEESEFVAIEGDFSVGIAWVIYDTDV